MFYGSGKKAVPSKIGDLLTPLALAYWLMDDGGITAYNQTTLNTDSFSYADLLVLQEALLNNFRLRTRLSLKRPGQWMIVIPVRQSVPLKDIVGEYMNISMAYKINM